MKALAFVLATVCAVSAAETKSSETAYEKRLLSAIWSAEGGHKTRYLYGIKSVKVKDAAEARRVCLETIRANRARWQAAGSRGDYLAFLAKKYCPGQDSAVWLKNVRHFMRKSR